MGIVKEDINKGLKELFSKRFVTDGFKYEFEDYCVRILGKDKEGFALTWDLLCAVNEIRQVNFICYRDNETGQPVDTEIHFK